MPDLISLQRAKDYLAVTHSDDDQTIQFLVSAASTQILLHLKYHGHQSFFDGESLTGQVPDNVAAATAYLVKVLFDGAENDDGFGYHGDLPKPVMSLLHIMRSPSMA